MSEAPVLYVLLHALRRTPSDFEQLKMLIARRQPSAVFFAPQLPIRLMSKTRAQLLAQSLASEIQTASDALSQAGTPGRIVIIGHSAGAMLGRAAWLCALKSGDAWAQRVDRMVLLAAVANGWRSNVAMSPEFRLVLWLGSFIDHLPGHLFCFDLRRGSAFMTTTRLRWLAASRRRDITLPLTVQLVGTRDDLVAPSDNIDLITGSMFHYLEVEDTGHQNVVFPRTDKRRQVLEAAIFDAPDKLEQNRHRIAPAVMSDLFSEGADDFDRAEQIDPDGSEPVRQAVMVVHGIRDYGHWTKRLANRIKTEALNKVSCRTVTSSYGYFPMGPFVLPSARRIRAEWLMDQYVRTRALYPDADISFVGHSNGTYLLTEALDTCPEIRFEAIVFAGSVVDRHYPWGKYVSSGRVKRVLNYVATFDWIVAAFPKFLGRFRAFRLGSAGTDGFGSRKAHNFRFAPGGHDAGILSQHWSNIAKFVLFGDPPQTHGQPGLREATQVELLLEAISILAVPFLILLAVGVALGLWWWTGGFDQFGLDSVVAVFVWAWIVGKFLKHF